MTSNAARVVLIAAAAVSGCSMTRSTLMVNGQGQVQRCAATGWGIVGTAAAHSMEQSCVADLRKLGYIKLPDVKLGTQFATDGDPMRVTTVSDGAGAAGIQAGDVIHSIDGYAARNAMDVYSVLSRKQAGDVVEVVVLREGTPITTRVTLAAR